MKYEISRCCALRNLHFKLFLSIENVLTKYENWFNYNVERKYSTFNMKYLHCCLSCVSKTAWHSQCNINWGKDFTQNTNCHCRSDGNVICSVPMLRCINEVREPVTYEPHLIEKFGSSFVFGIHPLKKVFRVFNQTKWPCKTS